MRRPDPRPSGHAVTARAPLAQLGRMWNRRWCAWPGTTAAPGRRQPDEGVGRRRTSILCCGDVTLRAVDELGMAHRWCETPFEDHPLPVTGEAGCRALLVDGVGDHGRRPVVGPTLGAAGQRLPTLSFGLAYRLGHGRQPDTETREIAGHLTRRPRPTLPQQAVGLRGERLGGGAARRRGFLDDRRLSRSQNEADQAHPHDQGEQYVDRARCWDRSAHVLLPLSCARTSRAAHFL